MSCSKVKNLTQIEQDFSPYSQDVNIGDNVDSAAIMASLGGHIPPGGVTIPFPAVPVPTNYQEILKQYNTSADKVNSVTIKSSVLSVTQPHGSPLNFAKAVSIYLSAPGLPMIRLAHKDPFPKGQNSISLDDTNANIKPYFLKDTMFVQITATLDSIPPKSTIVNATTIFHISANPLN
ncbi:MAG: hypothetical protein ACTHJ0_11170 [Flavipsychrobacter sp.]